MKKLTSSKLILGPTFWGQFIFLSSCYFYIKIFYHKIFSIFLPLASSSTILSKNRISCINGSSIFSTRTPQIVPVIFFRLGFIIGACKKIHQSLCQIASILQLFFRIISRKSSYDFQRFSSCPFFSLSFCNQHRIYFCKLHIIYFFSFHKSPPSSLLLYRKFFYQKAPTICKCFKCNLV